MMIEMLGIFLMLSFIPLSIYFMAKAFMNFFKTNDSIGIDWDKPTLSPEERAKQKLGRAMVDLQSASNVLQKMPTEKVVRVEVPGENIIQPEFDDGLFTLLTVIIMLFIVIVCFQ